MGEIYTNKEQADFKNRNRKKRMKINIVRFICVCVLPLIIVSMLSVIFIGAVKTNREMVYEQKLLLEREAQLRKENRILEHQKGYLETKEGKIRSARDNGYVMPGERVVIFESDKRSTADKLNK